MKKPTAASSAATATGGLDVSVVAALAKIAAQHDLSEVEVEHAGLKVRVARERQSAAVTPVVAAPIAAAPAAPPPVLASAWCVRRSASMCCIRCPFVALQAGRLRRRLKARPL